MDDLKTSRAIHEPFDAVLKCLGISVKLMAHDTKQSPQSITNSRHTADTTPANAVKDANYLRDYRFSNQMAAIYFEAIQMFSTADWSPKFQDAPFATLDAIDDQREVIQHLRCKVKTFMRDQPYESWDHEQRRLANKYSVAMVIKNIPWDFDTTKNAQRKKKLFEQTLQEIMPVEYELEEVQYSTYTAIAIFVAIVTQRRQVKNFELMHSRINHVSKYLYAGAVTQNWRQTEADVMTSRTNHISKKLYAGVATQQWRQTYAELLETKGVEA